MSDLTPLRIGVTGSRYFKAPDVIAAALIAAHDRARPHDGHVLVQGMCDPRHPATRRPVRWASARQMPWDAQRTLLGADWLAVWCALDMADLIRWEIESHPADWDAPCRPECRQGHHRPWGCPAAGNYRNQDIVDADLGELLAFYARREANTGTSDCVRRGKASGIRVESVMA